ncbi:hypothetical protein TNCV_2111371 [Trichonephila clavipes]|nr:hypothetical protein TNCV_2111371 [Trichonephila clavipes]
MLVSFLTTLLATCRFIEWCRNGYIVAPPVWCGVKSNTTPNHDTVCTTSVAIKIATVQKPFTAVSPNSKPTIVVLQAEAVFVSKYSVVPIHCPRPPCIAPLVAQTPVVSSQRTVTAIYAVSEEAVYKNIHLELAYKLRPLKGYDLSPFRTSESRKSVFSVPLIPKVYRSCGAEVRRGGASSGVVLVT